jgi:4-amino-4-deoxy-L-arabinose transferase-like glycosyltransferase
MLDTASEPTAAATPPRPRRGEVLLPAALLVTYAVLLLWDLSVPQPVDHSRYMDAARSFPSRAPDPIFNHQYLRIGLTAPTALVMRMFEYSEVTYHAFPVVTALLLFGSVYAIGRMLFGRLVGAASAVVLGCVGILVVAGTELLPDLPATALFTAAVALTVAIRQGLLGHRRIWLVVIGVLLGWSYLVREFIIFVWPLVPVLLWRRIGRWDALWALVPVALTGIGETAFNAWLYGDPLARLHAGSGLGDLPSRPEVAKTFHNLPLWVYLWRLPQQLATLPEGPGLLLLLALTLGVGAGCAVRLVRAWARRDGSYDDRATAKDSPYVRRAGVFALWILLLWVPLTLLGGVLNPAHPKLRLQLLRYWYPVFPAFVLGGVAVLWLVARAVRLPERVRAVAPTAVVCCATLVVAGLAVLGRPGAPGWAGSPRVSSDALPEFRSWLARSGARTVWADTKLYRILPIYFVSSTGHRVWRGHLRPLANAGQPAVGDYVVAYSVGSDACPRCGDAAKAALPGAPSTWRPVLTSHDRLLHVWQVG